MKSIQRDVMSDPFVSLLLHSLACFIMWKEIDNKLIREYQFATFSEAFVFLNAVARLAEEHQHHPAIFNQFAHVRLELTTHDAGDVITDLDRHLARAIDALAP